MRGFSPAVGVLLAAILSSGWPEAGHPQELRSAAGCSPSVIAWWTRTVGVGKHGRIACAAAPARPAILLFHGHQDARAWTAPSYSEFAYDYEHQPARKKIGGTHEQGNSGLYEVTKSRWLYGENRAAWDRKNNWFDFLVEQGYTVATWSQDMPAVADAMRSTRAAFDSFLVQTAARSPGAPPPVALIAHGRGGLLIRQILKEKGSLGRVKWVVTLHSPHSGTELARQPAQLASEVSDLVNCCTPPFVTGPPKQTLKELAVEAMVPLTRPLVADPSRELQPASTLYQDLVQGEKKLEDVTYYTFGGINPRVYRLHAWIFESSSTEPQYNEKNGQYFDWWVKPVEVTGVSPILDQIRDFAPEVSPGRGDALVSDVGSRLPWSIHTTTNLNHAELMWNRPLMQKVSGLIGRPMVMSPGRR